MVKHPELGGRAGASIDAIRETISEMGTYQGLSEFWELMIGRVPSEEKPLTDLEAVSTLYIMAITQYGDLIDKDNSLPKGKSKKK